MSMDFKPYQLYLSDCDFRESMGKRISEINAVYRIGEDSFSMFTDEEMAIRGKYPELSLLFDKFLNLYEKMSTNPALRDKILGCLEGEIKSFEERLLKEGIFQDKEGGYVQEWFFGRLDPCFYYREENNEKFMEETLSLYYKEVLSQKREIAKKKEMPEEEKESVLDNEDYEKEEIEEGRI